MTPTSQIHQSDGRIWCKICGITNPEDASFCSTLGVDAIGLAFVPESPRALSVEDASRVAAEISTSSVGLFVNEDPVKVREAAEACNLDFLQFNGQETPEYCEQFGVPYIRAVRMRAGVDVREIAGQHRMASALLLDAYVPGKAGGTGQRFDWQIWPSDIDKPLILAGGLSPANVAGAIRELHPSGVDVSGGVEGSLGKKDRNLIQQFVEEVRHVG